MTFKLKLICHWIYPWCVGVEAENIKKKRKKGEICCIVEGKHIQVLFVWLSNYDQLPSTQT